MSVKKLRLSIISFIMIAFIIMSTLFSIPMRTYARDEDRTYEHSISLSLSRSGSTVTYRITVNVQEYIHSDGPNGGAFFDAGGDYEVTLTYNGTTIKVTSGYYDARSGTCNLVSESGTFNCSGSVTATATIRYLNGGDSYGNDWTGFTTSASDSLNGSSSGGGNPDPEPDPDPDTGSDTDSSKFRMQFSKLYSIPGDLWAFVDFDDDELNEYTVSTSDKIIPSPYCYPRQRSDIHPSPFTTYTHSFQWKSTVLNDSSTHILEQFRWDDEPYTGNFYKNFRLNPEEIYKLYGTGSYYVYFTVERFISYDSVYTSGDRVCKVSYDWNYPTSQAVPSPEYLFQDYSIATIPSCNITRSEYVFKEWNTKPDGSGITYRPGDRPSFAEDTTLYAVWKESKVPYTINFTLNGEPATNDFVYITGYVNGSTRVTQSRNFSVFEIPGYTVSAKIKSSDKDVFIIDKDNKSPIYEYTIPARTINSETTDRINCGTIHTVAYDANGGTYGKDAAGNDIPGPEDMTKYYGTSIIVSSNTPTRIGYKFTQWQSDKKKSDGNPYTYESGAIYNYSQRGGTDTLTAQWEPITYTIHFDRNTPPGAVTEVTGNMADISQTYDVNSKLPKNAFKLDGCDFQGWNTKPDGSGDSYKDEEEIKNLSATDGAIVKLYAQWKVTYRIVGSLNGVIDENFRDSKGVSYASISGKMIRNDAVSIFKDGDCNGDGRITQKDVDFISSYLEDLALYDITGDGKLDNDDVNFISSYSVGSIKDSDLSTKQKTMMDYNKDGKINSSDFIGVMKIVAKYSEKELVAMDVNGDDKIDTADSTLVQKWISELILTQSKNKVFSVNPDFWCYDYPGYKITSSIKKTTDDVYIMGINDVIYNNTTTREVNIPEKIINSTFSDVIRFGTIHTIHFSPNDVTDGNGSTEATNVPDDITKYYGKDIKIPDAPKRDGYNFKGWTSDKTPDKIYNPGDIYNYAQRGGTDTLTAQWEPITYTIQFEKNKPASATHEVMYSMDNIGAVFDKAQNLPENQYKLAGWVFIGWNTKADGTGDFYADKAEVINLTIEGIVKLYAQWKNIDALPEGSKGGDNIPDDVPDSHGLMLRLNNNASLYSLEEEIREAMADTNGNLLYADNPDYEYLDVSDAAFSIVTTADENTCIYQAEGNKNSYYKVLNGESYIETTKSGKKILHKFVGWSVYKYATKSQSSQVIHTPGANENMLDLIYEYQAVNELGFNNEGTPANSVLSDKADQIISRRDDLINAATDIADRKIVVYAIWDEYPLMQVKDIAILSTDFENITDKAILEEKVIKEIEAAIITDKEDGNWNKGSNRNIAVSIDQISLTNAYEFLKQRYEYIKDGDTIYSSTGATSVNIIVTDKTGNKTAQIIEVWLNAANPIVVEKPGNVENDPNPIKAVTSYVRAISREFYDKSEEEGGLLTASRWKTDDEYKTELINTFDILEKDDGYDQIWVFNANEVKEVQNYIKDNGLGNSEKIDGLSGFLEKFKSCRIYKK